MAERPRRVDLRLTIPSDGAFRPAVPDLAVRFAEYAGVPADAAARFGHSVETAVARVASTTGPGPEIAVTLEAVEGEITATVDAGGRTEHASCPVPTR